MDWWIMLTFMCLILVPNAILQSTVTTTSSPTTTTTVGTTTTTGLPTTTTTAGTTTTTSSPTTTTTAGTTTTTSSPTTTTTAGTTTTTSSPTTTTTAGTTTTTSSPTTTTTAGTTTTTSSPTTTTTTGTTTTTSSSTTTTTGSTTTTTSSPTTTTTSGTTTSTTTTTGTTTTTNSTANTTTTGTTTTTPAATTTVAPVASFRLSFKILQIFVPALSNSNSPEFISLAKNITDQVTPIYRRRFTNFLRIIIISFTNGSIDTNSDVLFNSSTNASDVISAFNNSLSNFTFQVDPASLSVRDTTPNATTASPTTTTASPVTQVFSLIFSINSTFFAALADTSSSLFAAYASNITSQIEPLYRRDYPNFARMQILTFTNGSIVVQSLLFINSNGSNINADRIRSTLINGLNSLNFTVLSNSITVTQTFGNSMSPVIGSPLSMIWMSLLSLLLTVALRH